MPAIAPRCSVCSTPLDVHQVVRGGVCNDARCRGIAARRAIELRHAEATAAREAIARTQLPALLQGSSLQESQIALIAVPALDAQLSVPSVERRERFRDSVIAAVTAAAGTAQDAAVVPDEPAEHEAVRSATCGVCRGACCRYGGDTAYIDEAVVRRVRTFQPHLDDAALVALFIGAIPERTVEGSCILHGESGCALPRERRSHVCNNYYCRPIRDWEAETARTGVRPTAVFAVHEDHAIRAVLVGEDS